MRENRASSIKHEDGAVRLDYEHRERFEAGATDYETYDAVLKSLQDDSLRKLTKHCITACKIHRTSTGIITETDVRVLGHIPDKRQISNF